MIRLGIICTHWVSRLIPLIYSSNSGFLAVTWFVRDVGVFPATLMYGHFFVAFFLYFWLLIYFSDRILYCTLENPFIYVYFSLGSTDVLVLLRLTGISGSQCRSRTRVLGRDKVGIRAIGFWEYKEQGSLAVSLLWGWGPHFHNRGIVRGFLRGICLQILDFLLCPIPCLLFWS